MKRQRLIPKTLHPLWSISVLRHSVFGWLSFLCVKHVVSAICTTWKADVDKLVQQWKHLDTRSWTLEQLHHFVDQMLLPPSVRNITTGVINLRCIKRLISTVAQPLHLQFTQLPTDVITFNLLDQDKDVEHVKFGGGSLQYDHCDDIACVFMKSRKQIVYLQGSVKKCVPCWWSNDTKRVCPRCITVQDDKDIIVDPKWGVCSALDCSDVCPSCFAKEREQWSICTMTACLNRYCPHHRSFVLGPWKRCSYPGCSSVYCPWDQERMLDTCVSGCNELSCRKHTNLHWKSHEMPSETVAQCWLGWQQRAVVPPPPPTPLLIKQEVQPFSNDDEGQDDFTEEDIFGHSGVAVAVETEPVDFRGMIQKVLDEQARRLETMRAQQVINPLVRSCRNCQGDDWQVESIRLDERAGHYVCLQCGHIAETVVFSSKPPAKYEGDDEAGIDRLGGIVEHDMKTEDDLWKNDNQTTIDSSWFSKQHAKQGIRPPTIQRIAKGHEWIDKLAAQFRLNQQHVISRAKVLLRFLFEQRGHEQTPGREAYDVEDTAKKHPEWVQADRRYNLLHKPAMCCLQQARMETGRMFSEYIMATVLSKDHDFQRSDAAKVAQCVLAARDYFKQVQKDLGVWNQFSRKQKMLLHQTYYEADELAPTTKSQCRLPWAERIKLRMLTDWFCALVYRDEGEDGKKGDIVKSTAASMEDAKDEEQEEEEEEHKSGKRAKVSNPQRLEHLMRTLHLAYTQQWENKDNHKLILHPELRAKLLEEFLASGELELVVPTMRRLERQHPRTVAATLVYCITQLRPAPQRWTEKELHQLSGICVMAISHCRTDIMKLIEHCMEHLDMAQRDTLMRAIPFR